MTPMATPNLSWRPNGDALVSGAQAGVKGLVNAQSAIGHNFKGASWLEGENVGPRVHGRTGHAHSATEPRRVSVVISKSIRLTHCGPDRMP